MPNETEMQDAEEEGAMEPEVSTDLPMRSAPPRQRPMSLVEFLAQNATPEALAANTKLSKAFDDACASLLNENDFVVDKATKRAFKRKSAWKKLGRAFGVSVELVDLKTWYDTDDGSAETRHFNAMVTARAQAPWGQYADAVGSCSTREEKFVFMGVVCPKCGGPTWDNRVAKPNEHSYVAKLRKDGKLPPFGCRNRSCGGEVWEYAEEEVGKQRPNPTARAKALHDVTATAQTRASNRAISDLIAAGEVSAEEMEGAINGNHAPEAATHAPPPKEDPAGPLDAKVGGRSKHKDLTWQQLVDADPTYVEKLFSTGKIKGRELATALAKALDTTSRGPGPTPATSGATAAEEPSTQAQRDALADLLDTRDFSDHAPVKAWGGEVLAGTKNPSRRGLEEALLRIKAFPELLPGNEEESEYSDTDDLPY